MRENVGPADALIRAAVGGALTIAGVRALRRRRENLGPVALVALGALLVESAITRVCPLSHLFGIDTRAWPPWSRAGTEPRVRSIDARPPALLQTDWGMSAADLELPYDDIASFQRPPDDS